MLILDLWGISFHAAVVFGLGKDLLFKSVLGHCVWSVLWITSKLWKIKRNLVGQCYLDLGPTIKILKGKHCIL